MTSMGGNRRPAPARELNEARTRCLAPATGKRRRRLSASRPGPEIAAEREGIALGARRSAESKPGFRGTGSSV